MINRGAAIYGDKVYFGTLDASIVALNKDTGKVVWKEKFSDHKIRLHHDRRADRGQRSKTGRMLLIHGSSGDGIRRGRLAVRPRPGHRQRSVARPLVEGHIGRLNGQPSTPTGDPKAPSWPNDPNSPTGRWKPGAMAAARRGRAPP